MNEKYYQNMYYANVNVHLILKNITQIKIGITINVGASVKIKKKNMRAKNIPGILLHVVTKMGKL